jgi:hypothetical protein
MNRVLFILLASVTLALGQANPNPPLTATPAARGMLRQSTVQGIRDYLSITNGGGSGGGGGAWVSNYYDASFSGFADFHTNATPYVAFVTAEIWLDTDSGTFELRMGEDVGSVYGTSLDGQYVDGPSGASGPYTVKGFIPPGYVWGFYRSLVGGTPTSATLHVTYFSTNSTGGGGGGGITLLEATNAAQTVVSNAALVINVRDWGVLPGDTMANTTYRMHNVMRYASTNGATGNKIVFIPNGVYNLTYNTNTADSNPNRERESCIEITGTNIVLMGETRDGTILKVGEDTYAHAVNMWDAGNCGIMNLTIDSGTWVGEAFGGDSITNCWAENVKSMSPGNAADGFDIQYFQNFTFRDCIATNNGGSGFVIQGTGAKLYNCLAVKNGFNTTETDGGAFAVVQSDDWLALGCTFISATNAGMKNVYVTSGQRGQLLNCTIVSSSPGGTNIANMPSDFGNGGTALTIDGCNINQTAGIGIFTGGATADGTVIQNNRITGVGTNIYWASGVIGKIQNNYLTTPGYVPGMVVVTSTNLLISGNTFHSAADALYIMGYSFGLALKGNVFCDYFNQGSGFGGRVYNWYGVLTNASMTGNDFQGTYLGADFGVTNTTETITFLDRKALGTQGDSITSSNWTKVIPQTVQFSNTAAFTIASGVITVGASGAGNWRVQSDVAIANFASPTASIMKSRLRKTSGTPATLALGTTRFFGYYYDVGESMIDDVVTLAASDTLELQGYHTHTSTSYIGYLSQLYDSSGESNVLARITFTRIK